MNHDADYVLELRRLYKVPVFAITSDHEEIGKIQGQQFAALLPSGGSILYIEGPANSVAAKQRTAGMNRTKPANIQMKSMKANWTEVDWSAFRCRLLSDQRAVMANGRTSFVFVLAPDKSSEYAPWLPPGP